MRCCAQGRELLGSTGKPSGLRVQIYYGPASETQHIGNPYTTPHPPQNQQVVPASAPVAVGAPEPTTALRASSPASTAADSASASASAPVPAPPMATSAVQEAPAAAPSVPADSRSQTPDTWTRPPTPQIVQTLAGTPFAFYLELVEARNLSKSGGSVRDPYACISLFYDPASMEKTHFFLIDHYLASEAEDVRFLQMPPQHVSKSSPGSASPAWNDACTLKATHPGIKTILDLKNQQQLTTMKDSVPLAGQTVLMLVTVHDASEQGGSSFCGRVVIPQIRVGQPVDQWFMLHGRDGSQVKDASGQDAAVRLRFAYGAVKDPNPELPPGWEKKMDETSGKVFYVNHQLKTFSWVPPPKPADPTPPSSGAQKAPGSDGPPATGPTPTEHTPAEPEVGVPAIQQGSERSVAPGGSSMATKVCISINQGKDLPRMDHLSLSNAYVCVSIIGDADTIDEDSRARLQHDVSKNKLRAGLRSSMLKFYPLHKTNVVNRSLNPKWNEAIEFQDGYLNLQAIEQLQQKGAPKEGERKLLQETPVLVLFTVHHEVSGSEDTLIGKVLVPALKPGEELDEWFPLLSNDGTPQVGGMSEKPSQVHVRLKYEAEGASIRLQEQEALKAQEQERLRIEQEALRAQEQERLRKEEEAAQNERMRLAEAQQRLEQERLQEEARQRAEEQERLEQERLQEEARQRAMQEEEMRRLAEARLEEEARQRAKQEEDMRRIQEAQRAAEVARQQQELENAQRERDAITRAAVQAQRALDLGQEQHRSENAFISQAEEPVDMQLKLGLDFLVAGQPNSLERSAFEQNLIRDLSNASGLNPVSFRVQRMSPGSIIVDMQIHRDPIGRGRQPRDVAMDLEAQAKDPGSRLRNGILTCYTEAIAFPSLRPEPIAITPRSSPTSEALPTAKYPPKPSMHQAKLLISVLNATNLPQSTGRCNALCELAFEAAGRETLIGRTSAVVGSCDPRWEQHFVCGVDADQILNAELKISVVDWNPKMQNRLVGQVRKLRLSDLVKQGKNTAWFDLFTEEGFRVANTQGQASVQVALEYEAPFVQASLLPSQTPAGQAVPNHSQVVKDTFPLMSMYSSEIFVGPPGDESRSNWQDSQMNKASATNTVCSFVVPCTHVHCAIFLCALHRFLLACTSENLHSRAHTHACIYTQ